MATSRKVGKGVMSSNRSIPDLQKVWGEPRDRDGVWRDSNFAASVMYASHQSTKEMLTNVLHLRHPSQVSESNLFFAQIKEAIAGVGDSDDPNILDSLFFKDGADHKRFRALIGGPLHKRVAECGDEVARIVEETGRSMETLHVIDLVKDFSAVIPLKVIAFLIGVPHDDLAAFREWSVSAFQLFDGRQSPDKLDRGVSAFRSLNQYFTDLIRQRRAQPRDDLTSDFVKGQASATSLTDKEIVTQLGGLLMAGSLTTTDLISSALFHLLKRPKCLRLLSEKMDLVIPFIEEVLRFEPPSTFSFRIAEKDAPPDQFPYTKGDVLMALVVVANRDPKIFENPEEFQVDRKPVAHLTFGGGVHFCLGASLARLEAQTAVKFMLNDLNRLTLIDEQPNWGAPLVRRGLDTLRVTRSPPMQCASI